MPVVATAVVYEVGVVDVDGVACFWFDAPLQPWHRRKEPPGFLVDFLADPSRDLSWLGPRLSWYDIPETGGVIATPIDGERPTVIDVPYIMAAPLDDVSGRHVVWAGMPPPRAASSTAWMKDDYWVHSPATP